MLVRHLEAAGKAVRYAQNVTDIDESILQRAERDNVSWRTHALVFAAGTVWGCISMRNKRPILSASLALMKRLLSWMILSAAKI